MGKIKIHEIAKELGISSKEVIAKANELGIEVTSHLSSVEEDVAQKIKTSFTNKQTDNKEKKVAKKEVAPVIIRREVILADEDKEVKKEEKQDRKDVGFVERKKNQDFNIVYRKQPVKPMTVGELFGIKNNAKEEKKKEEQEEKKVVEPVETIQKEETVSEVESSKKDEEKKTELLSPSMVREEKVQTEKQQTMHKENRSYQNQSANRDYNNHREANYSNRQGRKGEYNQTRPANRYGNRQEQGNQNRFGNRSQRDNHYGNNQRPFNRNMNRPLDNRGIDRNIKNIMENEIVEKEDKRDISTRAIDKEKANRHEDNKAKKGTRVKKTDRFHEDFNEGKLKDLKQVDKLSNMFNEQDGGMLDYYDLTTERGKKNKRKPQKDEERNKQKIFELKEITIPSMITVKDLASEMKKTSGEVIKKLFNLGVMATINNTIDFDTAFLVAEEFGITAIKKEEVKEEDI